MKKLLLLLLFIPLVSFGQKSNDADALKLCVALQSNNFTTDAEAEDAVNKILSVIGTSQKPILQACSNINNAVAAVYKGQRYILYDRDFMNSLTAGSNQYWSNMFILAHEVGHHINGHSLDIILYASDIIDPKSLEEKRKQELEADEFAGFVLAKLGASLSQTSKVLSNLPQISNENSSTHPSKDKRIASVRVGFNKGEVKKEVISKSSKTNKSTNDYEKVYESSDWTYFTEEPIKNLIRRYEELGNKYDPFEIEELKKNHAVLMKISSVNGKSFRSGNKIEEVKLNIYQGKYSEKAQWFRGDKDLGKQLEKYMPYKSFDIYLENFNEMPKIVTSDVYGSYSEIPYDFKEKLLDFKDSGLINVKFHYMIDDIAKGFFVASLGGWKEDRSVPLVKNKNGKYFPKYFKLKPNQIGLDTFIGYDETGPVDMETELLNLIKFIDAMKKGNKLYLKMGNEISNRGWPVEWKFDSSLECHTYTFDLKGSSKALQF